MKPTTTLGIVLFAHGSRDPLWRAPVDSIAAEVLRQQPGILVRTAFLEWTSPDLPGCVRELLEAGANHVRILPMFLGVGKHLREDLPGLMRSLQSEHPEVTFELLASAGESPKVIQAIAALTLDPGRSQL